ncbi:MAG: ABC transporter ATP-binding protein [Candidatus Krumholzibacteriia bacterium]|nr:ABC transporter ATP-binding protein [bacterium]MCB9513121.1 ABC transporter ATP-binding protein [Candidatus Latescibacterota bacterium]MCB9514586.1 ABC transporter ATP-binding protein [Candidatus Latescibacterota bacterium]
MSEAWLSCRGLTRHYRRGPHTVRALDGVDLDVARGECLALVGASGSGKSTLLNLLAGLDTPSGGSIALEGRRLDTLSRRELAAYRARRAGMIFQAFNLLPHCSALENVELALTLEGRPRRERRSAARAMLERVGLADRLEHRPGDLSGGEQQRVAVARALVKGPELLFADEPTGNLDRENSRAIAALLAEQAAAGVTVLLATHDRELAAETATRVLRLDYGKVAP